MELLKSFGNTVVFRSARFGQTVCLLALSLSFLCASAHADLIQIDATGNGKSSDTWSFANTGNKTLSANASKSGSVAGILVDGDNALAPSTISAAHIYFQTGAFIGGTGTVANPFTWATGGVIQICNSTCNSPSDYFVGTFTDITAAYNGSNQLLFNAGFIGGMVNNTVLSDVNLSSTTNHEVYGSLNAHLTGKGTPGATGKTAEIDVLLDPVPEPASLLLLGAGLITMFSLRPKVANQPST